MYVRIKQISGRRYLYLVEGNRRADKVDQVTLSYLGPLAKLALGIPTPLKRKAESKIGRRVDWKRVTESITKIPLRWEELEQTWRDQYRLNVKIRTSMKEIRLEKKISAKEIFQQRAPGELDAIAKLAKISFDGMFEQIGERRYRMRSE